jgi:hypothetical protein
MEKLATPLIIGAAIVAHAYLAPHPARYQFLSVTGLIAPIHTIRADTVTGETALCMERTDGDIKDYHLECLRSWHIK